MLLHECLAEAALTSFRPGQITMTTYTCTYCASHMTMVSQNGASNPSVNTPQLVRVDTSPERKASKTRARFCGCQVTKHTAAAEAVSAKGMILHRLTSYRKRWSLLVVAIPLVTLSKVRAVQTDTQHGCHDSPIRGAGDKMPRQAPVLVGAEKRH